MVFLQGLPIVYDDKYQMFDSNVGAVAINDVHLFLNFIWSIYP